jgi:hypothetical protein
VVGVALAVRVVDDFGGRDCDEPFENAKWRDRSTDGDDRQEVARWLIRCQTLRGDTKRRVREVLGPPLPKRGAHGGRWSYDLGEVNDAYGPGDGVQLAVNFRDGRVRGIETEPRDALD